MTLFGVSFLVAGMLSCLVPISLLLVFASFFVRTARRLPPNAAGVGKPEHDEAPAGPADGQLPDSNG